jgi:general secretion pathway protein F
MTLFHYRAYTALGDLSEGEIEANSSRDAEEALWMRGLTPFETREVANSKQSALFRLSRRRKATLAEIASFTREFATLEQADVPIDQGLRIVAMQNASPVLRELSKEILRHIVDGASLSDALAKQLGVFASDYVNIIHAGEAMGDVGSALAQLADMLERRLELRARLQAALVYPALLIMLAIISTGVVLGVLVPNVAPIFADSGKPMPSGLQFIIDLEENWPLLAGFLLTLAAFAIGFRSWSIERPRVRAAIHYALLRTPFVGRLKAQHEIACFARTLGVMTKAGVPLLSALESARSTVADLYLGRQIEGAIEAVRGGSSLSAALTQIDQMPRIAPQMISIGEEAGKLDDMLLRIAVMFERQTQRSIESAMGLLTPLLTVAIAGLVGALIMTVMNAVLAINELAAQ